MEVLSSSCCSYFTSTEQTEYKNLCKKYFISLVQRQCYQSKSYRMGNGKARGIRERLRVARFYCEKPERKNRTENELPQSSVQQ